MLSSIVILIVTSVLLIATTFLFPSFKIKNISISTYWIVTLVGAILMVATSCISFPEIGQGLSSDNSVNPLKIICLFFSMTFLSVFLDEMGFFKYIAIKASQIAGKNQIKLFLIVYGIVSLLTIFTSNDIVILTFTPFLCYFAKNTKINPIPYLIMEFVAANTWSMLLIIGNPTNIYLATSSGVNFLEYISKMALPTLFAGVLEIIILFLLFRKQLHQPMEPVSETATISDKVNTIIGGSILLICIVLLAISSYINVQMWIICLIALGTLLLSNLIVCLVRKEKPLKLGKTAIRLPYQLIPFILGMFIIVLGLNKTGVTAELGKALSGDASLLKYGLSSFALCNLMNNIPMSVLYSFVLKNDGSIIFYQQLYATIISSNIGAFLTPLGALAGIMFTDLVKKQDIKFSFLTFSKYGFIIAIPTLFAAFLGLYIVLH